MLELRDVSLNIETEKGSIQILKDINLTLQEKHFYVITGPNGGGKSSLAKVIMGIYQPSGGQIIFNGQDITSLGVTERARLGIGYAFQQPPRFKGLTVEKLLQLSAGNKDSLKGCAQLYDVGLCPQDYINREVDVSLSGGELKRIEIATLLVRNLRVAIYDEPEAGIDLWSFSKLTETFRELHRKYANTMIIISHQERILQLADEIILIAGGEISRQGGKDVIWPLIMDEVSCKCAAGCVGGEKIADCYR